MEESFIKNLEAAAHIIMAPPAVVTKQQRQESEEIFMSFRKTKSPYFLCQQILEKSHVDFVLFEAADVLKKAVVTEWKYIPDSDKISLRQYLLNYIIQRDIPVFIRDKLLQVIAIMIKRCSIEDGGAERGHIIEETKKMLTSGDVKQKSLSCSILHAILDEFSNIVRSDDSGLTTFEHFRAKKQFEDPDLLKVFIMVLQSMEDMSSVENDSMSLYLFRQKLHIMESILTWGFLLPKIQIVRVLQPSLSKKIIDTSETLTKAVHAPPLRLNAQWKNIIFEPKLLELFFFIYWKVRDNEELQPKALICLLQLSTLKGPIISENKEESVNYLVNYITHFLQLVSSVDIKDKEAYSFSLIIRKLLTFHPRAEIKDLPNSMFSTFIQQMLAMTLKFIEKAALEEFLRPDEQIYIDALGNLLEAWLLIIQDKENYPKEMMITFFSQIFEKYVQYHIAPPEGMRGVGREFVAIDEITEFEESDRDRFKEQLIIIGYFGREILEHSLPLLSKILEDRVRNLGGTLAMLHSSNGTSLQNFKVLEEIFEDLHWLLLISGHILALEADGESAAIPPEINKFTCHNPATDVTNTLKLLASPNHDIKEIPGAEHNADPVIRLIAAGFRLCELEKSAMEVRMYNFLSPEMSSTLIWFIKRWADAYLMPLNEGEMSVVFQQAFGSNTPGSNWIINYLLNKILLNAQYLKAEKDVMEDTTELFLVLLKRRDRCTAILNSEYFRSVCDLKNLDVPAALKRKFLKGFVVLASEIESDDMRLEYLSKLMTPIEQKYTALISSPNFQSIYQNEDVKLNIIEILEEMIGCVQGAYASSLAIIFTKLQNIFKHLHTLLDLYRNYLVIVELILELLCEIVSNIGNASNDKQIRLAVYEYCMGVIRVYIANNTKRVTTIDNNNDGPTDLILVLKIINNLTSKTLFVEDDDDTNLQSTEICVYGLTHIVPLITVDLIKFPELCLQYYSTITAFIEAKSHMIPTLHPDLLKQMLGSIELGLTSFTTEIEGKCLEFLDVFANAVYFNQDPQALIAQLLQPFLKIMLDMIFGQKIDFNNTMDWYRTVFAIICCYPQLFQEMIKSFLLEQHETHNEKGKDLAHESAVLLNNLDFVNNRMMKAKFCDRFDRFVTVVSLLYKK